MATMSSVPTSQDGLVQFDSPEELSSSMFSCQDFKSSRWSIILDGKVMNEFLGSSLNPAFSNFLKICQISGLVDVCRAQREGVSPRSERDCAIHHPAGMLPMQQKNTPLKVAHTAHCTHFRLDTLQCIEEMRGRATGAYLTLLMALPLWNQRLGTRFGPRFLTRCGRTGYSGRILMALGKHDVLPVRWELMSEHLKTHSGEKSNWVNTMSCPSVGN